MVYSVSVDPDGDTPERAQAFVKRRGLDPQRSAPARDARGALAPSGGPTASRRSTPRRRRRSPLPRRPTVPRDGRRSGRARPRPYAPPERDSPTDAADPLPGPGDLSYRGRSRHEAGLDFEHSAYVMLIDKHGRQRVGIPFEQLDVDGLAADMGARSSRALIRRRRCGGRAAVRAGPERRQRRLGDDAWAPCALRLGLEDHRHDGRTRRAPRWRRRAQHGTAERVLGRRDGSAADVSPAASAASASSAVAVSPAARPGGGSRSRPAAPRRPTPRARTRAAPSSGRRPTGAPCPRPAGADGSNGEAGGACAHGRRTERERRSTATNHHPWSHLVA